MTAPICRIFIRMICFLVLLTESDQQKDKATLSQIMQISIFGVIYFNIVSRKYLS